MTITKILVEQGLYVLVRFPVSPWVFGRLKSIFYTLNTFLIYIAKMLEGKGSTQLIFI